MAERKPKKITEAPTAKAFTGSLLLSCEPFDFTPDKWLDSKGVPKEDRPVFRLRPFNSSERHFIEADNNKMTTEGLLWAKREGVDITLPENTYLAITKFSEFSDTEKRRDIVRSCILGFENLFGAQWVGDDKNGLVKAVFDRFPTELINIIEARLMKESSLDNDEVLGL